MWYLQKVKCCKFHWMDAKMSDSKDLHQRHKWWCRRCHRQSKPSMLLLNVLCDFFSIIIHDIILYIVFESRINKLVASRRYINKNLNCHLIKMRSLWDRNVVMKMECQINSHTKLHKTNNAVCVFFLNRIINKLSWIFCCCLHEKAFVYQINHFASWFSSQFRSMLWYLWVQ